MRASARSSIAKVTSPPSASPAWARPAWAPSCGQHLLAQRRRELDAELRIAVITAPAVRRSARAAAPARPRSPARSPSRMISSVTVSPGPLAGDQLGEVALALELVAVDGDDHVAAGLDRGALEGLAGRPSPRRPASSAGPPSTTSEIRAPVSASSPSSSASCGQSALGRDPEVGVVDVAVLAQLVEREADRAGRDREADARVGARRRLDLLVDADHLALGVEQRPAGVAGVDRGVGLDRVVDRELGQRLDRAVGRRDDPDRERLLARRTGCRSRPPARRPRTRRGRRARAWSGRGPSGSTLIRATSASGSKPTISACDAVAVAELDEDLLARPSAGRRRCRVPPLVTTWALVRISPSSEIDEARALAGAAAAERRRAARRRSRAR